MNCTVFHGVYLGISFMTKKRRAIKLDFNHIFYINPAQMNSLNIRMVIPFFLQLFTYLLKIGIEKEAYYSLCCLIITTFSWEGRGVGIF